MALPVIAVAASLVANWVASENLSGLTGQVACKHVFPAILLDPVGAAICLVILGFLLGPFAGRQHSTLSSIMVERYGVFVGGIASALSVIGSIMWAAAQYKAVCELITSMKILPQPAVEPAVLVILVLWTTLGGLVADVWLDFLSMMVVAPIVLAVAIIAFTNIPFAAISEEIRHAKTVLPSQSAANTLTVGIMGNLFTEELAGRILLAQSPGHARRACFLAAAAFSIVGMAPVMLGILAANTPGLIDNDSADQLCNDRQDQILAQVMEFVLPISWRKCGSMLYIVLLVESLNTVDTSILMCGKVVTDRIGRLLPELHQKGLVEKCALVATLSVLVGASKLGDSVWELAEAATENVGVPLAILCLFLPCWFGGPRAGLAGVCVGQYVYMLLANANDHGMPFVWSVAIGSAVYSVVAMI